MDYQLIALIGVLVATVLIGVKLNMWWPTRPGYEYQRVFNAAAAGLLFFIAGISGWDLRYSHGWFQGTKWVEGPLWWQVSLGFGLLLLAGFWARRVPPRPTPR
jgi:hypothetical protein